MKKALAISLLVICNLVAVFAVSILNFFVFLLFFSLSVTVIVGLAVLTALGFASGRFITVFDRKYSLKTRWFVIASYITPVAAAAVYWIVFLILDAAGYFKGWFAGVGELLYAISLSATAAVYFISGLLWCLGVKASASGEQIPEKSIIINNRKEFPK